jgi:CHAD domain-containing protein
MGVATAARVTFGHQQHMLAESGKMMTTDRTTIGRGLAIRRRAHRPPARAFKAAHRSILAPLAATVAATVLVGLVMLLSERERRSARTRDGGERRFELLPGEPPGEGLRRIALGQYAEAIDLLEGAGRTVSAETAIHDTRKALKRLRALLRLIRGDLGESAFLREDALLREAGLRLAGAREAHVMLATLDGLLDRHPRGLARRAGVRSLRDRLLTEREEAAGDLIGDGSVRADALRRLTDSRARVAAWRLPEREGIGNVEAGLRHTYRAGRRRRERAAGGRGGRLRRMHEWRRQVKHLRYAAEILRLEDLARRADELAEMLGEERDLALLAKRIRAAERGERHHGDGRSKLLKVIARRRRKLRRRAFALGRHLYRRRPRAFIKRVAESHASRAGG